MTEQKTLRDEFAMAAMPICYEQAAKEMDRVGYVPGWRVGVALDAYEMADAMLAARAQGEK